MYVCMYVVKKVMYVCSYESLYACLYRSTYIDMNEWIYTYRVTGCLLLLASEYADDELAAVDGAPPNDRVVLV